MTKVTRLLEYFQPKQYDISLKLKRLTRAFSGTVMIAGTRTSKHSSIMLHAKGLSIQKALINDIPAEISYGDDDEITLIPSSEPVKNDVKLTIEFSGDITDSMHGIYPCYYMHNGENKELLATQFESHHAREAFPCIDEPAAKALFNLTLETESDVTALGNMPIKQQSEQDDRLITTFHTSPLMSTYLLAFVVGDLHSISGKTNSGTEVNIWATKSQKKEDLLFAKDIAIRSIEFFDEYFQTPYPLPKADHIALPDFGGGAAAAMENWGLVTYREDYLIANKNTSVSTKQHICSTMTHEVSHQWFGNLVTMRWWDDLWLNESFANMMQYVATDALFPEWNIWTEFSSHESLIALRRDSLPGVQSVKQAVNHPDEINTIFDPAIVYAKGGQLLNMVRNLVGDDAFRKSLAYYFKQYAYQNTTGGDLWHSLAVVSDKDITSFIKNWLEKPGYPVVMTTLQDTTLTLTQEQFVVGRKQTKQLWEIPLFANDPTLPKMLDKRSLEVKVGESPIKLNKNDSAYFITEYDQALLARLVGTIDKLSEVDRLQLLNEVNLLSRGLRQPTSALITLLEAYRHETSQPVWETMLLAIGDLRRLVEGDKKAELHLRYFVGRLAQPLYTQLGWHDKKDDNELTIKLRATIIGLMLYAENEKVTNEALKQYESIRDIAKLNGELRTIVLSAAVKYSDRKPEVIASLLEYHHLTSSSELQGDIAAALTSTRDRSVIKQLLGLALDGSIRKQDFPHWFIYLTRNYHGRTIAWQWLKQHWDWVIESYGSDKGYDIFPRCAASVMSSQEELNEYTSFFTPMRSDIGLKRAIDIGINEINSRVSWFEKNQKPTKKKLEEYYLTHSPKK